MRAWRKPAGARIGEDGVSTIEFAIVAPAIALLVMGVIDLAAALWDQMQVSNAAEAGAFYASAQGWNATVSTIQSAVTSATSLSSLTASPSPTWPPWCGCPNTSTGIASATCGSTCSDGSTAGHYVTVYAQAPLTAVIPLPGITLPTTLTATSYARIYP